jgi:hypothetical protein
MARPLWYILNDDKTLRPVKGLLEWAEWAGVDESRHIVAHTMINDERVFVSTIFLGVDHNWRDTGESILFETMIFGGEHDRYQARCSTWEQALRQHAIACGMVEGKVSRFRHG